MRLLNISALLLTFAGLAFSQTLALKPGDRVVFYGDSITDQRLYTTFAESYFVTRFPTMPLTFTHSGWGGDRVSGGGGGNADTRLDRDVFPYKPTVVTIMLGMNDGAYKALDQPLFEKFQAGYRHIVEAIKKNDPATRIVAIQPSAYDDVTREFKVEGGYNATLVRYSAFLKDLAASDRLGLADLNGPVVEMLKKANAANPTEAQKIIPDRVHPGPAGHIVMAAALLKAWNAPALVTDVDIDAAATGATAKNAKISNFEKAAALSWDQLDAALPMPIDPNDKLLNFAVDSSDLIDTLDQEMLRVRNLSAAKLELRIDGAAVATFTKEQLEAGVNLARLNTPMLKQALTVHQLTVQRATAHNIRWRQVQVPMTAEAEKNKTAAMGALDGLDRQLARLQRDAAQPREHHYELRAVN